MQVLLCDMEECTAREPFSADHEGGLPKGWAFLQWTSNGKGATDRHTKLMAGYFRAMLKNIPGPAYGKDHRAELDEATARMEEAPDVLLTFRAYLCPDCLGKLAIKGFNLVSRGQLPFASLLG